MGPIEDSVMAESDARLRAAREALPEWDIYRVFGGYLAVPKGAPVVQSMDADGIVEKVQKLPRTDTSE
jgi:hypothetical protein